MSWQPVAVRQGPNHPLHLVLTLATCGLWAFVWIPVTLFTRRTVITGVRPVPYAYPVMAPGAPPPPQPPPPIRREPFPPPQDDRKQPPR